MNELELLVIHTTATPNGRDITMDDIRKWHLSPPPEGRGWSVVGYSDMIYLDGSLHNLTPFNQDNKVDTWEVTNGALGINGRSRHVVYVGGLELDPDLAGDDGDDDSEDIVKYVPADTRNEAQLYAMEVYVKYMILRHPNIKVAGHSDFANKACPCFNVAKWARSIGIAEKNIYVKQ